MGCKKKRTSVVALGGNAITREFEEGNIYQQFANTRRSLTGIVEMIDEGIEVILTHGNGPQVGNSLLRVEETRNILPPIPLGVLVADTQGGMGYMIEQSLTNMLMRKGIKKNVTTVLTQVVVDRNDPSILDPTKYVGPFYEEKDVETLKAQRGWTLKKDANRGWRRVVPSPMPLSIVEQGIIRKLIDLDIIVIACGGGGIPVYIEDDGTYEGVDAVIDKDRASAVLAVNAGAEEFVILTAVDKVALHFGTPNQRDLDRMTVQDAKKYLESGEFPAGSMGPKIESAVYFLENGGKEVLITSVERFSEARKGLTGTKIVLR